MQCAIIWVAFLFVASSVTGIAGVVAIASLNYFLQGDLGRNVQRTVGRGYCGHANRPSPQLLAVLDSSKLEHAPGCGDGLDGIVRCEQHAVAVGEGDGLSSLIQTVRWKHCPPMPIPKIKGRQVWHLDESWPANTKCKLWTIR